MKKNQHLFLVLLLLTFISLSGCESKTDAVDPEIFYADSTSLKTMFHREGYTSKLNEPVNDSLFILWNPAWNKATMTESNDTTKVVYVPLIPQILRVDTKKEVEKGGIIGYGKYVIFKITSTYTPYLAVYHSPDIKTQPIDLTGFTGNARFSNLKSGEETWIDYVDGVEVKRGWIIK